MNGRLQKFQGITIRAVTEKAYREMAELGFSFVDVAAVLEEGYNPGTKRKSGIIERCAKRNGKTIKVVVEKVVSQSGIPYWRIRHVGVLR